MCIKLYETKTKFLNFGRSDNEKKEYLHNMPVRCSIEEYMQYWGPNRDKINKSLSVDFRQRTDRYKKVLKYIKEELQDKLSATVTDTQCSLLPERIDIQMPSFITALYPKVNKSGDFYWYEDKQFYSGQEFSAALSFDVAVMYNIENSIIDIVFIYVKNGTILPGSVRWESDCVYPDYLEFNGKRPSEQRLKLLELDYSCVKSEES